MIEHAANSITNVLFGHRI